MRRRRRRRRRWRRRRRSTRGARRLAALSVHQSFIVVARKRSLAAAAQSACSPDDGDGRGRSYAACSYALLLLGVRVDCGPGSGRRSRRSQRLRGRARSSRCRRRRRPTKHIAFLSGESWAALHDNFRAPIIIAIWRAKCARGVKDRARWQFSFCALAAASRHTTSVVFAVCEWKCCLMRHEKRRATHLTLSSLRDCSRRARRHKNSAQS